MEVRMAYRAFDDDTMSGILAEARYGSPPGMP
jgi:hypothetical protein